MLFSSKISVLGQFSGILMPMKVTKNIPMGRGECPNFFGGVEQLILIKTGGHYDKYEVLINGLKIYKISAGSN